jgi:prophage endopeptidase
MNPLLLGKLVAVITLLAMIGAGVAYVYHAGKISEREVWEKREAVQVAAANAKILELNEKYRALENDKAKALSIVSNAYEEKLNDAAKKKDRDVAAARSNAPQYQLRYATTSGACADRSNTTETPPTSPGHNGPAVATLPPEVAADLFALADDADAVVEQLTACQQVVIADRKE